MSMGFRADPTGNSGVITVAGVDQVVITNASNVVATTFTGALAGNAATATALSTTTGTAPSYGARAWVNFDATRNQSGGSDTAATNRFIRGNGNVSSVLRNSAGNYTITFATAMPDANYATVITTEDGILGGVIGTDTYLAGSVRFRTIQANTSLPVDVTLNSVVVFR